jgi:hypothetical protein
MITDVQTTWADVAKLGNFEIGDALFQNLFRTHPEAMELF